jgi:predicted transposase/invertase (TIGR01784 family)
METQKWTDKNARIHISPTSDIFVRYLLASPKNTDITKAFINAVLEDSGQQPVKSVKITSPFNLRQSIRDKETVMDVKVQDSDGRSYDIEIQNTASPVIMERLNYYGTHLYVDQIGESEQYDKLRQCIVIALLRKQIYGNGNGVKPAEKLHHISLMVHYDDHESPFYPHGDPQIYHILELDRFENNAEAVYDINGTGRQRKLSAALFGWLRFFSEGAQENFMEKYGETDELVGKAKREYEKFLKTQRLRDAQFRHEMWLHDRAQDKADARNEGLVEGRAEGVRETVLANARSFRRLGVSDEIIAEATGLSKDEIAAL